MKFSLGMLAGSWQEQWLPRAEQAACRCTCVAPRRTAPRRIYMSARKLVGRQVESVWIEDVGIWPIPWRSMDGPRRDHHGRTGRECGSRPAHRPRPDSRPTMCADGYIRMASRVALPVHGRSEMSWDVRQAVAQRPTHLPIGRRALCVLLRPAQHMVHRVRETRCRTLSAFRAIRD